MLKKRKKNKIDTLKNFIYLCLITIIIILVFSMIGYISTQKVGVDSKAFFGRSKVDDWYKAETYCTKYFKGIISYKLLKENGELDFCRFYDGSPRGEFPNPIKDGYFYSCRVASSSNKGECAPRVREKIGRKTFLVSCKKDQIIDAAPDKSWCKYITKEAIDVMECETGKSYNKSICAAGRGGQIRNNWNSTRESCLKIKGKIWGKEKDLNGSLTCYIYNGGYKEIKNAKNPGQYEFCTSDFKGGDACK